MKANDDEDVIVYSILRMQKKSWYSLGTTIKIIIRPIQARRHGADWGEHVYPTFVRRCSWHWCRSAEFRWSLWG